MPAMCGSAVGEVTHCRGCWDAAFLWREKNNNVIVLPCGYGASATPKKVQKDHKIYYKLLEILTRTYLVEKQMLYIVEMCFCKRV